MKLMPLLNTEIFSMLIDGNLLLLIRPSLTLEALHTPLSLLEGLEAARGIIK